jgi:hypothetical protein
MPRWTALNIGVLALATMLAIGLAVATQAAAAFDEPVTLSGGRQNAFNPQVAMDGRGRALVVWERSDGTNSLIQARRRSPGGVLGHVHTLSEPGQDAYAPQVAVDADDNALIVWQRFDGANFRIQARWRSADGGLGPVQTLSNAGQDAGNPQVAIDGRGRALVVWSRFDGSTNVIQARARSAAGVLRSVQTLSAAGRDAYAPQVAMNADGNALIVWEAFDGTNFGIEARGRSAAGVFGPIEILSRARRDAVGPQVAIDGKGRALVAWSLFDGANHRLQVRGRSATGVLQPVHTLTDPGRDASFPQIAVDPDGNAVIVWELFNGLSSRIQIGGRSATGVFAPIETVSGTGDGYVPQVAVRPGGAAMIVWQQDNGTNYRIQARGRSAAGVLQPVHTLSEAGQDAQFPQVAMDADGNALAVWYRSDGAHLRIQAAADDD